MWISLVKARNRLNYISVRCVWPGDVYPQPSPGTTHEPFYPQDKVVFHKNCGVPCTRYYAAIHINSCSCCSV